MSVTKEQRHFLAGHARSGVYDTAKIYSAWLQFRARALLARPRICTRLHTYTRHVQSWGRGSCRLWGVAGMESNSVHNLRSFVRATATGRDATGIITAPPREPDITTILLCAAFRPKTPSCHSTIRRSRHGKISNRSGANARDHLSINIHRIS